MNKWFTPINAWITKTVLHILGYDSVPNLMEHLVDLLVMRMDHPVPESIKQTAEDKKIPTFTTCDHPQEDSGVDTG